MPDGAKSDPSAPYRSLPSVAALLGDEEIRRRTSFDTPALTEFLRVRLERERAAIAAGAAPERGDLRTDILRELEMLERPRLAPLLNASGVIVHTNLGRAPVSQGAATAMAAAAASYVALEVEPESGRRGGRMREIAELMRLLTGAEATIVVNNNAAAVLLVLAALASGREAILSRGEAVEIGGGFRIPDVMRQSGARLVEVGTTNRTYADDYAAAISAETALLLKVHPSNFKLSGFVASPTVADLAAIARARGIPLVEDLGSGALLDTTQFGLAAEPTIAGSLAAGATVVTASGDKLLGGPQAGIISGDAAEIAVIERHPLARAVRADKVCLAGIAATLRHYARGEAVATIPIWRMIAAEPDALLRRADRAKAALAASGVTVEIVETVATVGGGSLPGETLPSVALTPVMSDGHASPGAVEALARRLRAGSPALFGRIEENRLLLDLRTVLPEDDDSLVAALVAANTA